MASSVTPDTSDSEMDDSHTPKTPVSRWKEARSREEDTTDGNYSRDLMARWARHKAPPQPIKQVRTEWITKRPRAKPVRAPRIAPSDTPMADPEPVPLPTSSLPPPVPRGDWHTKNTKGARAAYRPSATQPRPPYKPIVPRRADPVPTVDLDQLPKGRWHSKKVLDFD